MTTKSGKRFQPRVNTDQTKRFYYEVWTKVAMQGLKSFGSAPLTIEMDVFPPDKRKRDIDNVVKPTLDALQKAGLFDDDNQICRLIVTRLRTIQGGEVVVRIQELIP